MKDLKKNNDSRSPAGLNAATHSNQKIQSLTWMPSLVVVVLIMLEFIARLIASWAYEMTVDGLRLSLRGGEGRLLHRDGKHASFGRPADLPTCRPADLPTCRPAGFLSVNPALP